MDTTTVVSASVASMIRLEKADGSVETKVLELVPVEEGSTLAAKRSAAGN